MYARVLFLIAMMTATQMNAQCTTNITVVGTSGGVYGVINSLTLSNGQLAKLVTVAVPANDVNSRITVTFGTNTNPAMSYSGGGWSGSPIVLVGPATIAASGYGFCTVELCIPCASFVPSTAVAIPADSGGPVNIILESSADLITWTAALPGTYGTSTKNRFFRVRALRTQ